jgi:signal transduction histidine kinase
VIWQVVTGANFLVMLAYFGISGVVLKGLIATNQLKTNPLAVATSLIFMTCAVHHGSHAVHMLLPSFGVQDAQALAMREAWHWPTAGWDIFSAIVAFYYLSLRHAYGALLGKSPGMFADFKDRERQALEIHDNIVQGLTAVRWSLDAGRPDQAREASERTLAHAQAMMAELLDEHPDGGKFGPGSLRRDEAASPLGTPPPAPAA